MRAALLFVASIATVFLSISFSYAPTRRPFRVAMSSAGYAVPAANSIHRTVIWFRNDLRIQDNPLLHIAASAFQAHVGAPPSTVSELICVYCFDPRYYTSTTHSPHKTGLFRAQFLIECVESLRHSLRGVGSDLYVSLDRPETLIPKLLAGAHQGTVLVHKETTFEETEIERCVEESVANCKSDTGGSFKLRRIDGGLTLHHPADLTPRYFDENFSNMSDIFSEYRREVERSVTIRALLPRLEPGRLPPLPVGLCGNSEGGAPSVDLTDETAIMSTGFNYMPCLEELGFSDQELIASRLHAAEYAEKAVMLFRGGESEAWARITDWIWIGDHLKDYFDIRNGMLGQAYSTKLSPWLAAGCISARQLYYETKRYESLRGISNRSTYWIQFELMVRDFFRFLCEKHGKRIFYPRGASTGSTEKTQAVKREWSLDVEKIRRWKTGQTGQPLVDANMRELLHTGWMSNRGRQNVASYLVLDLGIDWRVGADHFESMLLDHDVCSNYGNWNAAAGLTEKRLSKFNCTKQSFDYDPNGDYIRHWVHELQLAAAPDIFSPSAWTRVEQQKYKVRLGSDYPKELPSVFVPPAAVKKVSTQHREASQKQKSIKSFFH